MLRPRHHHRLAGRQHRLTRAFVVLLFLHVFLIGSVVLYNVIAPHSVHDAHLNISPWPVEFGGSLRWLAAPAVHVLLWSLLGMALSFTCFLPGIRAAFGTRHALGLSASALLGSQTTCLVAGDPAWHALTTGFGLALASGWLGAWLMADGLLRHRGFRRAYRAATHHLPFSLTVLATVLWSQSRTHHLVVQASAMVSGLLYAWLVIFCRIRLLRRNPGRLTAILATAPGLGTARPPVSG